MDRYQAEVTMLVSVTREEWDQLLQKYNELAPMRLIDPLRPRVIGGEGRSSD